MKDEHLEKAVFNGPDREIDALFPLKIQKLATTHWTPVEVARRAADFLVKKEGTKVLDIGSGVGKFCMAAAAVSQGLFTGVEQRDSLIRLSNKIAQRYQIERVEFIHANIRTVDFSIFDAFYFFNSFEENRDLSNPIDDDAHYDMALYETNTQYLYGQFKALPIGTRIATYCTFSNIIPDSYVMVRSEIKGKLKFWEKRF